MNVCPNQTVGFTVPSQFCLDKFSVMPKHVSDRFEHIVLA